MFSAATPARLSAPRPPTPIMAIFSLSFRFRPRTIVGTAITLTAVPTMTCANWRRVGRPDEEGEQKEVFVIEVAPSLDPRSIGVRPSRGRPHAPFVSLKMVRTLCWCKPEVPEEIGHDQA